MEGNRVAGLLFNPVRIWNPDWVGLTKEKSDSVAIIFVVQMLSMQKEGAAHRNIRDIAVRCTCSLEVILFDVRYKNRGN